VSRLSQGLVLAAWLTLSGIGGAVAAQPPAQAPVQTQDAVARYGYRVVRVYPHDPDAFTQGLFVQDGHLFESTGMVGASSLREVDLDTGTVRRKFDIDRPYFAEGIAPWQGRIVGLTWKHGKAFVWDEASFAPLGERAYEGEGWGLTGDGAHLILSDGSDRLRFLDPETFKVVHEVSVTLRGAPVDMLNELEYIDGQIYANVWQSDYIVRIDPDSGHVTGVIDLKGLMAYGPAITQPIDVLNGIAFDPVGKRLLVTGKYWPAVFEIQLIDKVTGQPYAFK